MQNIKSLFWKKKSDFEIWFKSLDLTSVDFIRFITFFGVGFLCGLMCKRCGKYVIFVPVCVAIVFALLHSFSIITINFGMIQKLTGIQDITDTTSLFLICVQVGKKYMMELISGVIGFFIGFKTG